MSDSEPQRPDDEIPADLSEAEAPTDLTEDGLPADLTEDELRAAYEAELKRIRVDDVLVQTVVSLLNIAARRAGLTGGDDEEIDLDQVGQAIEATRALLPFVEPVLGPEVKQVKDALSQLQLAYARSGAAPPSEAGDDGSQEPEQPPAPGAAGKGPAQSSGRLWVPGQ